MGPVLMDVIDWVSLETVLQNIWKKWNELYIQIIYHKTPWEINIQIPFRIAPSDNQENIVFKETLLEENMTFWGMPYITNYDIIGFPCTIVR